MGREDLALESCTFVRMNTSSTSEIVAAAIAPQNLVFLCLCVATLVAGIAAQLIAILLVRRGIPVERYAAALGGDRDYTLKMEIFVLERESLVYLGNSLNSVGNLLIFASVAASLAIDFPSQWPVGSIAFTVALVPAVVVYVLMIGRCLAFRNTQQILFEALAPDTPSRRQRSEIEELRPDFAAWCKTRNLLVGTMTLLPIMFRAARRYDRPFDIRYAGVLQNLQRARE